MALTSNQEPSCFSYELLPWGDLIYGTREELQALGLAVGQAYPGEPGGPKRPLKVTDPRGFPCVISRAQYRGEGQFTASIPLPGRERTHDQPADFAPGVTLMRLDWGDIYKGTADALAAAGLVQPDQIPGAPGRAKTVAYFDPAGRPTNRRGFDAEGGIRISKVSANLFDVWIHVSSEESDRRDQARREAENAYLRSMSALPRPRPLIEATREATAQAQRAQMRLVWSRPFPGFSLPS